MITLLAILKAGLAYVPLAPNWPEGRIRHVIEDSGPVLIITNQAATPAQRVRCCIMYNAVVRQLSD